MNKITIIGAGKVGSTIAYTLSVMNLAKDIVMIDINHELALGEALDIRQGTPFSSNCSVYAGDYPDAANSNIVVITSGVAGSRSEPSGTGPDQREYHEVHHAPDYQICA